MPVTCGRASSTKAIGLLGDERTDAVGAILTAIYTLLG